MSCTCVIGRTLDAGALSKLDEALRTGTASLGKLAAEHGLKKPTVGRHRLVCLGLDRQHGGTFRERSPASPDAPDAPDAPRDGGETARDDRPPERDGPPRARAKPAKDREDSPSRETAETVRETANGSTTASAAASTAAPTPEIPPRRRSAAVLGDGLVHPEALGVAGFGAQVRFIADLLSGAGGGWKDRRSVKALCAAWGLGPDAIHERHRAAAVLAGQDRGGTPAQLENTIGLVTAAAEECEAEALKLERPTDENGNPIAPSEDARQLALKYRALAAKDRGVRMRLEGLLQTKVSISVEGDPRLAGLWPVLWRALGEADAQVRAYAAEASRLAGGVVPVAELPDVVALVKAEIRAYEERLGGRQGDAIARLSA